MEKTFVMIKPDGVQRGLIGEIISRIERKGLKIVAMKMLRISKELAKKHYAEHQGKSFFDSLISYITSGPVVAMVIEGKEVCKSCEISCKVKQIQLRHHRELYVAIMQWMLVET